MSSPIRKTHTDIIRELSVSVPGFRAAETEKALDVYFDDYSRMLAAVAAFSECPETIECRIMGLGEQLCIPVIAELLRAKGEDVEVLDSRKMIITEGHLNEGRSGVRPH